MAITESPKLEYWNYFLSLEQDLARLSRFVELSEANFSTYSIEQVRLLLASCSEIDVLAKALCKKINSRSRADSINKYASEILQAHPRLKESEVIIRRHGLRLNPWIDWSVDESPQWWRAYNKVKHQRSDHFREASLKNTLNALAALFVLLPFYYQDEASKAELEPRSLLFEIGQPFKRDRLFWGGRVVYKLETE